MRRFTASRSSAINVSLVLSACFGWSAHAQNNASAPSTPPPVIFTAAQDHQNMMDQLGIKRLRPGPSGNEKAPDHANYDEAVANPHPHLPDALLLNNGQPVTTAKEWWNVRRPQIVQAFEENVYGRVPADVPAVHWSVAAIDHEIIGGHPVIAKA